MATVGSASAGLALRGPSAAFPLLMTSRPSSGGVAREEEGTKPNGRMNGWPRGSRSFASDSAPQRDCALVAFGLGAEVLLAKPARLPTLLPFRARHDRHGCPAETAEFASWRLWPDPVGQRSAGTADGRCYARSRRARRRRASAIRWRRATSSRRASTTAGVGCGWARPGDRVSGRSRPC